MNKLRVKLAEALTTETYGSDLLSNALSERMQRVFNPWTAPLSTVIEPESDEIMVTDRPEFPR
jgi:hypothetical protein